MKTYGGHGDEITDACGSCDSCHIVTASLDKSIIYWDVTTAQPLRRLRYHAGGVSCVRFNENSNLAISGGRDNLLMCWDIRTRNQEPIQVMNDARDCITSIIVTDHGITSASLDGCIRKYDIRSAELICDEIGPPITYAIQTKDGQCIVAAFSDDYLRLIDNDSGEILAKYTGHNADDYQIECGILANDSQIVSGSVSGCAVIWDLVEEKEIARLKIGKIRKCLSLSQSWAKRRPNAAAKFTKRTFFILTTL